MVVNNKFKHGDTVYLKTDADQKPRMIYCFKVYPNEILYEVVCGTATSAHYEFELSSEANVLITSTN